MDNLNKLNSIYKSIYSQLEFANSINSPVFIDAITRNYNFMNEIQSIIDTFKIPEHILSSYNFIDKFKNPFENLTTISDVVEKYNSIVNPLTEYLNYTNFDLSFNETLSAEEETEIVYKVIDDIFQDEDFSLDKDLEYIENTIYNSIENVSKTLDNPKSVNKSSFLEVILQFLITIVTLWVSGSLINVGDIDYNKTNNTYNIENVNIINNEYNHKED